MVCQLAAAPDRVRIHHGCRSFLRNPELCISLNRKLPGFKLWLIAVTLLFSRSTVACQQIVPENRSSSEYTGIEIIPRGAAWKAPDRPRSKTAARPAASRPAAPAQPDTAMPLQENRPQTNPLPYTEPKPFHRNSQAANTPVSTPSEIRIKSPNFARRNAENEALQTTAEYPQETAMPEPEHVSPTTEHYSPTTEHIRPRTEDVRPTLVENAVPLIHIIEPPPFVRPGTETTTAVAATAATPKPLELWKPMRRFERAEPLIDQAPMLPENYAASETQAAESQTEVSERFEAWEIETPVLAPENSNEPRVVAPEPRKPGVRKPAVASHSTNHPVAGHSLLAGPARPRVASLGPVTPPQGHPQVAGHLQNSEHRPKPMSIPRQPQPIPQPLPAAVASGRYGRPPSTAHTSVAPFAATRSKSRYGAPLATNANHAIPASAPTVGTRYAPASSQHQSVPTRQAGHSMLQSGTSYRQTR